MMRFIFILLFITQIFSVSGLAKDIRETQPTPTPEQTREAEILTVRTPLERQLAGGETHDFLVKAEADEAVLITVEQRDIDVSVAVYNSAPVNDKINEADFSLGVDGTERVFFIAPKAGNYRIEVRSLVKNAKAGGYRIQLSEKRSATALDRRENLAAQRFYAGSNALKKRTAEFYREALKNFDESIVIWQETGNDRGVAQALYLKIDAFFNTNELKSALAAAEVLLPLWRKIGDRHFEADTLYSIGVIYGMLDEETKSLDFFQQARSVFRDLKNSMGEGKILAELGFKFYRNGDYRQSLTLFEQALPLSRKSNDFGGTGRALMAMGVNNLYLGEPDKSIRYFEEALPFAEQAGDPVLKANILSNVADAARDTGDFDKAFDYSRQSLELMRKIGDRFAESGTLHQYGDLYRHVGDYERAIPLLKQSIELAKATNRTEVEPLVHYSLGIIYREKGDYEKSNQSFRASLEISRKMQNDLYIASQLNELAWNQISLDQTDEALANAMEAVALFRKTGYAGGEAAALRNIGYAHYKKGASAPAKQNFGQMLAVAERIKHRNFEANAHYFIALLERDQNNLQAALASIEKGVQILEATRSSLSRSDFRTSFLAGNRKFYELYIDVLLRLSEMQKQTDYAARAFEISEQSRARTLVELLKESGAAIRTGANPVLLAKEREINIRLSSKAERQTKFLSIGSPAALDQLKILSVEISDLTEEREKLAAEIRRTSPQYAALTQPAPLKAAEIQALLDKDTVLLEYSLGDAQSTLWLATNDSLSVYKLPKREEIESAARAFYESLETNGGKSDERAGNALTEILLKPVADKIAGKRIVVVGEGALQYVPFAALPDPKTGNQLLIQTNEIINLPSASALAVLRRAAATRKSAAKTLAIFADPVFSPNDPRLKKAQTAKLENPAGEELQRSFEDTTSGEESLKTISRLPFSRREAEAIFQIVPPKDNLKAVDFAASAENATGENLSNFKIIHFATHGLLNSKNPELSGLVLSLVNEKGERQNGFLRLSDIYNLRLNSDLVVLSACQTALGKDIKGEGLIGLTRGFMYAGSPRVVSSLWKVDDAATAVLMKHFYQNMLQKKQRPAQALRAAQIEMSKDERYRSPYYWAAFALQGEWR